MEAEAEAEAAVYAVYAVSAVSAVSVVCVVCAVCTVSADVKVPDACRIHSPSAARAYTATSRRPSRPAPPTVT